MADGGLIRICPELRLLNEINRYGVEAVMGRPLYYHEILSMNMVRDIVKLYNDRHNAEDWARWAQENNAGSKILNEAMKLAREYGWE